jgi:hypothetical protein
MKAFRFVPLARTEYFDLIDFYDGRQAGGRRHICWWSFVVERRPHLGIMGKTCGIPKRVVRDFPSDVRGLRDTRPEPALGIRSKPLREKVLRHEYTRRS